MKNRLSNVFLYPFIINTTEKAQLVHTENIRLEPHSIDTLLLSHMQCKSQWRDSQDKIKWKVKYDALESS